MDSPETETMNDASKGSSRAQRVAQRERIGVRVIAILDQFWQRLDKIDAMQQLEVEGWMDVLEPLDETEIRKAWAEYQRTGPRSAKGALLKPDAGAIYRIAMAARQPAILAKITQEEHERKREEDRKERERWENRPSPETIADIIRQSGLNLRFEGKPDAD